MDITNLIECVPANIKQHILDFQDVRLKDGRDALRVILDRVLTTEEQAELAKCRGVIGANCIAHYKYAPEIKRSYFYLPYNN